MINGMYYSDREDLYYELVNYFLTVDKGAMSILLNRYEFEILYFRVLTIQNCFNLPSVTCTEDTIQYADFTIKLFDNAPFITNTVHKMAIRHILEGG